jgi:hypothetical protein
MIYTCYEMIRDCRADRAEGWRYFIAAYVPVIRKLLAHYQAGSIPDEATLERVLLAARKPQSSLFQSLEPSPERWFAAELRQKVMEELPSPAPAIDLDLETVTSALEPLTMVEKQTVWLETMRYAPAETGVLMRMAPPTVEKIRAKAAELIRGKVDSWSQALLAENGRALGRAAAAAKGDQCLPQRTFLEMVDGRATWQARDQLERHVTGCWHCIDHFCRLLEVAEMLRGDQQLSDAEAAPFCKLLGVPAGNLPAWKRWLAR